MTDNECQCHFKVTNSKNMSDRDDTLKQLLRLEVAKKGRLATYAFAAFSLFSFFYGYGCVKFLPIIKATSIFLFILTGIRHLLYNKIVKQNSISSKEWLWSVIVINLNGIGFALILNLASFELQLSGQPFVVTTTLIAGLVGASIVTLSYFPILFIPFQTYLLIPQMFIILYYYFFEQVNHLELIILYVLYYIYQIKQFRYYRRDLVQLFTYQIELEHKNKELEESKDVIVDQTVKLVHTSRLAVLGEMSVGIAHEINNPLSVISSSVQMLDRSAKTDRLNQEVIMNYAEKISKAVTRISSIVKGLKMLANQSERVPKKEVLVSEILNETTPFYQEHFNALGIKLNIKPLPKQKILCHPVQISQVLMNLLKNASDAILEGQESERWINLDCKTDNDFFYFLISNSGKKISAEMSRKLFTPFLTTKKNGTGIGLSISQAIMKEHDGEIYLDYDHYEHTTFVVKLPLIKS